MAVSVIKGLVLREVNIGEADKLLTILAKGIGKVTLRAGGARSTRNKFGGSTSLFTYGEYTIRTGTKHHFLNQGEALASFYTLTRDLDSLACGNYILELTDKTTAEEIPADSTLYLAVSALNRLSEGKVSPRLAAPVFVLKLLQYNGLMPHIHSCVVCGKAHENIISPQGTLCHSCSKGESTLIMANRALIYALEYIEATPPPTLFDFNLDLIPLRQLSRLAGIMLDTHYGFELKSKKFINSLKWY